MARRKRDLLLLGLLLIWPASVRAQEGGPGLVFEGRKEVVTENVYFYKQYKYSGPSEVRLLSRGEASYGSPEEALTALISAMSQTDYEWWINSWTEDSRKLMVEKDKEMKRAPDDWKETWRKVVVGRRARLLHRIETGPYVLIEYALTPADAGAAAGGRDEIVSSLFFEKVGGVWLATQRMQGDPVGLFWRTPEVRPRILVRQ